MIYFATGFVTGLFVHKYKDRMLSKAISFLKKDE
jgi:hypothetical protein